MMGKLADRLREARRRCVVGRGAERRIFDHALTGVTPFLLLNLYGPGGVGKSTLVQAFCDACDEQAIPAWRISGQEIDASPGGVFAALGPETLEALRHSATRQVLLIDNYESLETLEAWLRESFLPTLGAETLVVLAGRNPISAAWRGDLAWQGQIQLLPIRNLDPADAQAFLLARQIPESQHAAILSFTHGYPLALSLVCEDYAIAPQSIPTEQRVLTEAFLPPHAIVQALLERFIESIPTPTHRAALAICALLRVTTEPILEAVLETKNGHAIFEWLRSLSFIETLPTGLCPHAVAREALLADLRWRSPDRYADYHKLARGYYANRFRTGKAKEQQDILWDYVFLHHDQAVLRDAFTWENASGAYVETATQSEASALRAFVASQESEASARLFEHWFAQPKKQTTLVFRSVSGAKLLGFMMLVFLEQIEELDEKIDPAIHSASHYLKKTTPLRSGDRATYFRFWMDAEKHQQVSPVQSMVWINCVRHYLTTPGLVHTFFPCADPGLYADIFAYVELGRVPEADFTIDTHTHGVFAYNWRTLPPLAWFAVMADKELSLFGSSTPPPRSSMVVLSREAFESAIKEALKYFNAPERLVQNALIHSRIIVDRIGGLAQPMLQASTLRGLLKESIEALQASPKRERLFRALSATFLQPSITQEQAAERLDLPFSTYRRHLTEGIAVITEVLWQQELEIGPK
jgi:hypothetical protein